MRRSRAHLVIDSDKKRVNKLVDGMQSQRAKREGEVQLGVKRAKEAAAGDTRELDDTGLPLHSDVILRRLTQLSPLLTIRPGNNNTFAVFVPDHRLETGTRFLVAFERGMNTEFARKELNPDGSLKRVIPGWRRVLARLQRERVVTEAKCNLLFGPPTRASLAWKHLTT